MTNNKNEQLIKTAGGINYYHSPILVARRICPFCGETYDRFVDEIEYISDNKYFCSYVCKVRYNRKRDEELKYEKYKLYNKEQLIYEIENYTFDYSHGLLSRMYKNELYDLLVKIAKEYDEEEQNGY